MKRPNVISHRGANIYCPQNTLPAFERSSLIGVDGFETDVHVTKDGQLVICHNYTVDETSTGEGKIEDMTLEELKKLDFGSYFSPKFKGTPLPTLEEFLSLAETADISVLNIELKSPGKTETGMVRDTITKVKEHNLFDKLIISSFDPNLLVEAKQVDSSCRTGYLYSPEKQITYKNRMMTRPFDFAQSIKADALHPMYVYVNKRYVEEAHRRGLEVNVWTVDSVNMIERMIKYGVDGIITNMPDVTKGIIEKYYY